MDKMQTNQERESQMFPVKLQGKQADIDYKRAQAENLRKPAPQYVIPQYDANGAVIGYSSAPQGSKVVGGGKPVSPGKNSMLSSPQAASTYNLYKKARQGLLTGLGGSETGPVLGRIPAVTSDQQVAEGSVAAMAPVLKQLFRVAGEGTFTDKDQALLLDMIPTRKTRPEARKAQIENIDNIVKAKLGITNEDETQSPEDYLNSIGAKITPANINWAKTKMGGQQ